MRIGQGVDAHRFALNDADRVLHLGGVLIPGAEGLEGHSDGDALLHAITDAILGAAALGDLGSVFGVDDPQFAGASSTEFVREAVRLAAEAGWQVGNLDSTIVAERPRVAEHLPVMRQTVAEMLGIAHHLVSIKATSTDGMGFTGRGEGIVCLATVLLKPR